MLVPNFITSSIATCGDFSKAFKNISKTLNIVNLKKPEDIFSEYKKAFDRKDGVSTVLVEYGDYYNLK